MKTILPQSINTVEEAKAFLTDLHNNGEAYHPEDNAASVGHLKGHKLTKGECWQLDKLMGEIYGLQGANIKMDFDPCEFLLQLNGE